MENGCHDEYEPSSTEFLSLPKEHWMNFEWGGSRNEMDFPPIDKEITIVNSPSIFDMVLIICERTFHEIAMKMFPQQTQWAVFKNIPTQWTRCMMNRKLFNKRYQQLEKFHKKNNDFVKRNDILLLLFVECDNVALDSAVVCINNKSIMTFFNWKKINELNLVDWICCKPFNFINDLLHFSTNDNQELIWVKRETNIRTWWNNSHRSNRRSNLPGPTKIYYQKGH